MTLPKPESPVVEIHVDAIGVLDLGKGQLALDAFASWLSGGTVPAILEVPVFVYTGPGSGPEGTAGEGTGAPAGTAAEGTAAPEGTDG